MTPGAVTDGAVVSAAIAYVPWVIRARDMLGVQLPEHVEEWLAELAERPAIRAELDLVAAQ